MPDHLYVKTANGWSELGMTLGPIRFTGNKPDGEHAIKTTVTMTASLTMSRPSPAGMRWWRRQRRSAHNSRTYRKPVAVKPALSGRRHGW